MAVSALDGKGHYGVIIIGSGVSGLCANIQIKKKLGFNDVICYEADTDVGGTWLCNTYPGAAVDIPAGFYSFSFAPNVNLSGQWVKQQELLDYVRGVRKRFKMNNIVFRTKVVSAHWSPSTALWTVQIRNLETGEESTKTCNVLISAVGGLREPQIPDFALDSDFKGPIFHSARWDHSVDLTGKDVVIVGNGCSAAQIIPMIMSKVGSITQIARSRQAILPRPDVPDGWFFRFLLRWVPGLLLFLRCFIFLGSEALFSMAAMSKFGEKRRQRALKIVLKYMHEVAPKRYWNALTPDFDVSAKRRIYEDPKAGLLLAMNDPKFNLLADEAVTSLSERSVITSKGKEVKADVVVLSTGFKVQDFMFPLKVYNGEGENLVERLKKTNARAYRGTFVSGFPNLGILLGPNTATGHSSVIFTSECQVTMILKVLGPIIKRLKTPREHSPVMYVDVKLEAEKEYYRQLREAMKGMVWERNGGVSWYVNRDTGLCTALYPWSQINFWRHATWPVQSHFHRVGLN